MKDWFRMALTQLNNRFIQVLALSVISSLSLFGCSVAGWPPVFVGDGARQAEIDPEISSALEEPAGSKSRTEDTTGVSAIERAPLPRLPLPLTQEVRREIFEALRASCKTILSALNERDRHYAAIAKIFLDEGLPLDLINLAIIESGFQADARSPAGAVGIWQFTAATAKSYGLRVSGKLDERKDILKSTLAAARLLGNLYRIFGDWHLALAAYNAGPGGISRAMKRSGARDYWTLIRKDELSMQTAEFVPKVIATTVIVKVADSYGREDLEAKVRAVLQKLDSQIGRRG